MITNEVINYIQSELAKGTTQDSIVHSLLQSGWQQADIDQALAAANTTQPSVTGHTHATEKDYPITKLWIFKAPINIIFISLVAIFFGVYFPYLLIALPIYLIANPLIRSRFHYSVDDKFFVVQHGVFSKKQKNLPYAAIQNVVAKRDVFDRIFGLATLRVENAAIGSPAKARSFRLTGIGGRDTDSLGASTSRVNIPGLRKTDAEALKGLILQKIKDNPLADNQSGL